MSDDDEYGNIHTQGTIIRDQMVLTFIHEAKSFWKKICEADTYEESTFKYSCHPFDYATISRYMDLGISIIDIERVFIDILNRNTNAEFWTKLYPLTNANALWSWLYNYCADIKAEEHIPEEKKEEVIDTLLVRPKEQEKDGVVDIVDLDCTGKTIGFRYDYDRDFISIMHDHKCKWNRDRSIWCLTITERSGSFDDRSAEIGKSLLEAGFSVKFLNKEQLEKLEGGTWEARHKRWIGLSSTGKYLIISFGEKNDELYEQSKLITGAKWDKEYHGVRVLIKHYRQVEDFAQTFQFSFDKRAADAVASLKEKEVSVPVAKIGKGNGTGAELSATDALEILNDKKRRKSDVILEDLRDD